MKNILIILLTFILLMSVGWSQPDTLIYSYNPDMDGQFMDAVLVNRNPDCRAYATDTNDGDYGSYQISDISNDISDAVSDVHIDLVIASNWNASAYNYDNVTLTNDPELATHCRMISNMIPNHDFGVTVTGPGGGGWINAIDHSDIEVTYVPVDPVRTNTPTDTPRNPPTFDFDGILLNGVGISMDSGFCYNPGVTTGPLHLRSNEAGNTSGCGPQNSWFELPAYTIWHHDAENMAAIFDSYFAHGYRGTYHYHALTHPLQEDTDQTEPPANGDGSPVIGFAPDGFPIYGHWFIDANNQLVKAESGYETYATNSRTPIETALHGTPPTPWDIENNPDDFASDFGLEMGRYEEDWYFAGTGNLDECNGAYDFNGDYGYYITDKYPFTPPCTFGTRDPSFGKKSPTLPPLLIASDLLPKQFTLHPNHPNPFNPLTTLKYDLPEDALVNITIYDMMGRQVKALLNDSQTAGYMSIQWNATNDEGKQVSAGLYLYTIQAGEFRQTKKMVLLK